MSMKQMKNSAFFSLPHHLSYKPCYSFSSLPLRISVVNLLLASVVAFLSPISLPPIHSSELHVQFSTPSPALVFSVFY
ncbi:hypothetical protein M405DRAFT_817690, partial [Rhizopogon salebrosus TDB-379]